MAQSVWPFELVAWGPMGVVAGEMLSETGARISHSGVHAHGARIEVGLRHVTAAAGPVLVPCAGVAVPGPPDETDPAKKRKTVRAMASDGAGSLSATYMRDRDGGWGLPFWTLEYDSAKSRSPTMRAYCAHVAAKRAAQALPTRDARRRGVAALRCATTAQVEEAREKLRAAEGVRAEAEALAEAELAQVAREEAFIAASVAEMERALP